MILKRIPLHPNRTDLKKYPHNIIALNRLSQNAVYKLGGKVKNIVRRQTTRKSMGGNFTLM